MKLTDIKKKLLVVDPSEEMVKAIETGIYYVEATPCIVGYSIGCHEDDIPALMATKEEADVSNKDMIELYKQQIKDNERDDGDFWQGEVLECRWNGTSELMELYDLKGNWVNTESWIAMAGL
jgi:hypothetical protein